MTKYMAPNRKNRRQLRVTPQNDTLAEQLLLEYQLKTRSRVDWTYFGNLLLEQGITALKRELRQMR